MLVGGWRAATASVAVSLCVVAGSLPVASADPGVLVYPGMEIHQGTTRCTLGYVDPAARTGYTAGHCRGDGPVTDKNGRFIEMEAYEDAGMGFGNIKGLGLILLNGASIVLPCLWQTSAGGDLITPASGAGTGKFFRLTNYGASTTTSPVAAV